MMNRFTGDAGIQKLIEALAQQEIVGRERLLAERLAAAGKLVEFQPGAILCQQGSDCDDVFFIISGKVDIIVNGHVVSTRQGGQTVGELAAVDPSAGRSATVRASSATLALQVTAEHFIAAGNDSATFWRLIAQRAGARLREREKFHIPANAKSIMFVGSSVEGLPVARGIQTGLEYEKDLIVRPWFTSGVFGPSRYTVDDLCRQADEADFAAFVFGPDDRINWRDEEHEAPRDNVVFEMGLFLGRLGRERVFLVKDAGSALKLPSDLIGVNPIDYRRKDGDSLPEAIGPVCNKIIAAASAAGPVTNRMTGVAGRHREKVIAATPGHKKPQGGS